VTAVADQALAPLFAPLRLTAGLTLPNRIVLAPCTRNRAQADLAPTRGAIAHYASRAAAGLLITEATLIARRVQGYIDTPGMFLDSHVAAWADVTDAVHRAGGRIFLQLWHPGRMAHSHFTGVQPLAPSAVLDAAPRRQVGVAHLWHEEPKAMSEAEIAASIHDYAAAAARADRAGFDGVEVHGANGYLPEQFLRLHTNRRTDAWGGPAENRARFAIEVVDACAQALGYERVGLRVSPAAYFSEMRWTQGDNEALIHLLAEVERRSLAYVHCGIVLDEPYDYLGGAPSEFLRRHRRGVLIGNGGYTPQAAARRIADGAFDLIAFGKHFLANPDLVARLRAGLPLARYDRAILDSLE
jgi:2,4-dienoyl-CoA reductase-like NADH-dependent reductase (Old Yellow Enzyme family)